MEHNVSLPYSYTSYSYILALPYDYNYNRYYDSIRYLHEYLYQSPESMTIVLVEDGEIADDYSQFDDEDRLKQELIFREETISEHLKIRTCLKSEDHAKSQEPEICVICQAEYEDSETIGKVECGHEYHVDCIKKWLLQSTLCPICKTTALATNN